MTVVRGLHLLAAPTFALMALLTAVFDRGQAAALCMGVDHAGLGGMAPMYLLMAVFHSAPWLNLMSQRRSEHQTCAGT
jgi:hypothetical protein